VQLQIYLGAGSASFARNTKVALIRKRERPICLFFQEDLVSYGKPLGQNILLSGRISAKLRK